MVKRILNLGHILKRKSLFLFGPRMTGKTTFLKDTYKNCLYLDLLDLDTLRVLQTSSKALAGLILANKTKDPIVIDEIQKMPELLDEIHRIIEENKNTRFILTGSSARKLKKVGVNLLGGRASEVHMKPLSLFEISHEDYSWEKALAFGLMPAIVTSPEPILDLKDYVSLYLQKEIREEALVKNFLNFSRFIDFAAHSNTELLNFTALGSRAQIPPRTVQDYFSILEDTLLGERLVPFGGSKRKVVSTSKFYFFDIGVVNYLTGSFAQKKGSQAYGKSFEQLVYCELSAFKSYNYSKSIEFYFWRTQSQVEVDFILIVNSNIYAIECKTTPQPRSKDFAGLNAFKQEHPEAELILVLPSSHSSVVGEISVLSLVDFINWLWKTV